MLTGGDEVLIDSPGGGGYGEPLERERERVARDVFERFITPSRHAPSTAGTAPEALMGMWREQTPAVWETVVTPCDCCGQVVAKRLWIVEIDGGERRFCSPECEALFREYVLPRHARDR